jgi:hypothetical protein
MNSYALCLLALILLYSQTATAQIKSSKYEAGIAVGAFVYQGDLTPNRLGSFPAWNPQTQQSLCSKTSSFHCIASG